MNGKTSPQNTFFPNLPAVGRKIKGHAKTLLSGFDVGLVECVTLLDSRESGILYVKQVKGFSLVWFFFA